VSFLQKILITLVLLPGVCFASEGGHVDLSSLWWRIFIFILFAGTLYYLLHKRVKDGLSGSIKNIEDSITAAEKACEDARSEFSKYTQKIEEMNKELEALRETAKKTAQKEVELLMAEAERTAEKLRVSLAAKIESEQTKALSALKAEIAALAVEKAENYFTSIYTDEEKQKFTNAAVSRFGK
jgi:F-type H+-transporting ATPase subunit b